MDKILKRLAAAALVLTLIMPAASAQAYPVLAEEEIGAAIVLLQDEEEGKLKRQKRQRRKKKLKRIKRLKRPGTGMKAIIILPRMAGRNQRTVPSKNRSIRIIRMKPRRLEY